MDGSPRRIRQRGEQGMNKFEKLFEKPYLRTRITSADVSKSEMVLGYFTGPFIAMISNAIFGSYLNRYYTDVIGLTGWAADFSVWMPVISVIFIIAGNLIVGQLIDKTRTSQGKSRPYLLLAAPFLLIAIILLFCAPNDGSFRTLIWIAISYNLYYAVAYPFYYTSHSSMVSLSTRDSGQRGILATLSNASGVAAIGAGASVIFPLFQGYLFVTEEGAVDAAASYEAWRIFIIVMSVITFLGIVVEYYYTRERITEENLKLNIKEEKRGIKEQFRSVVSSRYWWIIILYFFFFQLGGMIKNGSMSYYCRWMFDAVNETQAGDYQALLGIIGGLPTALGMVIAWPVANKIGKQKAIAAGMFFAVIGGAVSFLDVHSFTVVCTGVVLKGIGSIPGMYVSLALMSDVLDHLEAKNGFRSDGFTMSVYGAIMVGMTGLGTGIINFFLGGSGYDAALAVQSQATQNAMAACYLGAELVCYLIIAVLMLFLTVEKDIKTDQEVIIEHQKAAVLEAGGEWVDPAERLRIEQEAVNKKH